jgi:uncharacterized membrane protein YbhN (UPF0104 family)
MPNADPAIPDILTAAGQKGHAHMKAVMGEVSVWLVAEAKKHGLEIAGFHHCIETAAVRHIHIHTKHGNAAAEARRGQIAITFDDFARIPDLLNAPDKIIFGATGRRNQNIIAYIKELPDSTVMYLEEVRTGRRELATISMRKYPATIDANTISGTLNPNGRTDSGDILHIVEVPHNVTAIVETAAKHPARIDTVTGPALDGLTDGEDAQTIDKMPPPLTHTLRRRVLHYLPPVLGVLVLSAIIFGLHRALKHVSLDDVLAALKATPGAEIAHALLLLGVSFCIMLIYDIPGILFAKKLFDFPRLGMRRIGLASFSAYSLSHVLGAPALSAAAIRLRLYAQWGVPAAGIARIITLSGTMFALGTCALLGGVLLFHPLEVPLLGHDVTPLALRALGAALWVVIGLYVRAARKTAPLQIFGKTIPRPGWGLAITQVLLSCADTGIACAILYVVLPTVPGLTYPHVLAIYLAAFAGGLFSGLPGGVGVFDSVLLLGLAGTMDPARAIGAILLFRVLYYLGPAALGGLCFAGHEIWITARRGKPEV